LRNGRKKLLRLGCFKHSLSHVDKEQGIEMRRLIASIGFVLASFLPSSALQAQETTFTVGTAGNITATSSLAGNTTSESISTAQIDGVLRVVAPGAFGQNFTRDRANKVFADFANFRNGLASSLAQTIASQSNIRRVNSVVVNTNALNLRLSQKTNSVSGELGSIMTRVSLLADVDGFQSIFCPSVNVTFDINNIKASGDYNFISGDVSNAAVTYDLVIVSASCNGLLGGLFNPTSAARSQINNVIQDQINTQLTFINMQRLFSLSDFANGLRYYGNETIISPLVNRAINVFRELVNDAAINTPGIVINIGVQFASVPGSQNVVSFIASHAPVDVVSVAPILVNGVLRQNFTVAIPPNTQQVDLYTSGGGNWSFIGSGTASVIQTNRVLKGNDVIAIGRNGLISGLESFPGRVLRIPEPTGDGGRR
jgi:hypothetical protein